MKVEKVEGSTERTVLIGMITNDTVLARVAGKWDADGLFANRPSNIIGRLCVRYHNKHHKAPYRDIRSLFASWAESRDDRDGIKLVEELLSTLSDEDYENQEDVNPSHVIDLAANHFNTVRVNKLASLIQGSVLMGDVTGAEAHITNYRRIELGSGARNSPIEDEDSYDLAFGEQAAGIVEYSGGLGKFFGNELGRDCFIALQGSEKSGKSFWLMDIAYTAVLQRKKVVMFEVGDMSKAQILRRLYTRIASHPVRSTNPDHTWPCKVRYPVSIRKPQELGKPADVVYETREFDRPLNKNMVREACVKVMTKKIKSKKPHLLLSCHGAGTINVAGIRDILDSWELADGWSPDCIVIDYADILAPPSSASKKDSRDQINATWTELRQLSSQRHCLVVTATQADANSYDKATQDRRNFSNDHRKLAHVTGLIGINSTPDERVRGVQRLNWLVVRDMESDIRRCVHVAQCLPLAHASVCSVF